MSTSELSPRSPRSRRLVFGVRALMVLVLFVAVGLGWKVNRARIQKRAVARIEAAGGFCAYDDTFRAPAWLHQKIDAAYFQEVSGPK